MRRRSFVTSLPFAATPLLAGDNYSDLQKDSMFYIGPKEGYSPHIGVLVSKLHYNRQMLINLVNDLTTEQLDHLLDEEANSIGALLMHLGATEKYYLNQTMEGRGFNEGERKLWGAGSSLGDRGRKEIRNQPAKFYIDLLDQVRKETLQGLAERDDSWLLKVVDAERNVNNYWSWFHVCEHEAGHRGQITLLRKRLPS